MPSTYETVRAALTDFIRTEWNMATSSAPLAYNNIQFDPPTDGQTVYGRLHIQHEAGDRASLGGARARFRREGRLALQVFTPANDGTLQADQIADQIVVAIEAQGQIDNIWFRNARMREVGPDGTFFQVNVEVEFVFDRIS